MGVGSLGFAVGDGRGSVGLVRRGVAVGVGSKRLRESPWSFESAAAEINPVITNAINATEAIIFLCILVASSS